MLRSLRPQNGIPIRYLHLCVHSLFRYRYRAGALIIIAFGILTGFATNYPTLLAFRVIVGFGLGGATIPFDLLAEFTPHSVRGQFLVNINYFWTIGSMFVAATAWIFLSSEGWKFLAIATSLPVAVSLFWAIFVLPESPRWLLVKKRTEEAEKVLRDAALYNGVELPPFTLKPHVSDPNVEEHVAITEFFKREMLPVTIPLWYDSS
jgi:MFS family permease